MDSISDSDFMHERFFIRNGMDSFSQEPSKNDQNEIFIKEYSMDDNTISGGI